MAGNDMYSDEWTLQGIFAGNQGESRVRETLEELRRSQMKLKATLDKGVKPDDFKKGQALLGSYEAAIMGIEKAWDKRRQG